MGAGKNNKYSNQVVIAFMTPKNDNDDLISLLSELGGDTDDYLTEDEKIVANLFNLTRRVKAENWDQRVVKIPIGLSVMEAAKEVRKKFEGFWNERTRVILLGHGDWREQFIGDFGAGGAAQMLVQAGMPNVSVVNVLACELGCVSPTTGDSFAKVFHGCLKEYGGILSDVTARTLQVQVSNVGKSVTKGKDTNELVHKRPNSKIRWTWAGNKQARQVVY